MTPAEIKKTAAEAGLPSSIELPDVHRGRQDRRRRRQRPLLRRRTCASTRSRRPAARRTRSLPRFSTADGKGTDDEAAALKNDEGKPVDNPVRNLWINETALSTALNTAYMAERISLFGIVTGIAMLLTGIGLGLLSLAVFGMGAAKRRDDEVTVPSAAAPPTPA